MNTKLLLIAIVITCFLHNSSYTQNTEIKSERAEFFEQTYGKSYQEAISSPNKNIKLDLAQKILGDAEAVKNEPIKIYMLLKAVQLTENFGEGHPISLQIYNEIFKIKKEELQLKYLSEAAEISEQYYKFLPSTQSEKRNEIYEKKLNYEITLAKLLFKNNKYKETNETVKKAIFTAKALKLDKTLEMLDQVAKNLLPLLQIERNLLKNLEDIKANTDLLNNINQISEILIKDYGNLSGAIPFLIKSNLKQNNDFAINYRKFLAQNKKASAAPLFLTENDLDLPDEEILNLFEIDDNLVAKVRETREAINTGNKRAILELIKIGESLIDNGQIIQFNDHISLVDTILSYAEKSNNVSAKLNLYEIANKIIYHAGKDEKDINELKLSQIKIKDKNINDKLTELKKDKSLINFDKILTSPIKITYTELNNKRFLPIAILLKNVDVCYNKDISNPAKIDVNAPLFLLQPEEDMSAKGFSNEIKWQHIASNNLGTLTIPREKNKVSILSAYLVSTLQQKVTIKLATFAKTFVYADGKLLRFTEKDNKLTADVVFLPNKEIQIRVVIFNGDSNDLFGNFSLGFFNSKDEPETGLQTFLIK